MNRTKAALALICALALAGCAGMQRQEASQENTVSASATVAAIDQATRQVTLTDNEDGTRFTVTAGPEIRNLPQLAVGDQVQIDYFQATTVSMADPADSGEPAGAIVAGRAPEGDKPGGAAIATRSFVVTLVAYDANSGIATFRSPDGLTRSAAVPPNLRTFAQGRGPGSRVLVTLTEAVAVTITEAAS